MLLFFGSSKTQMKRFRHHTDPIGFFGDAHAGMLEAIEQATSSVENRRILAKVLSPFLFPSLVERPCFLWMFRS
jgi:hypothetical protein